MTQGDSPPYPNPPSTPPTEDVGCYFRNIDWDEGRWKDNVPLAWAEIFLLYPNSEMEAFTLLPV